MASCSTSSAWLPPGRSRGSCLAARVCRSWRAAAAGCRGIHLLYTAGHHAADQSFATWLRRNSQQLGSLTLNNQNQPTTAVLQALADAAAAATAAGRPLPMHTLRVLHAVPIPLHVAGQLLAALPKLRCLELDVDGPEDTNTLQQQHPAPAAEAALIQQHLAPLQQATQLEELYLRGPYSIDRPYADTVVPLLPASLKRFSWWGSDVAAGSGLVLTHLTQLTSLQPLMTAAGRLRQLRSLHLGLSKNEYLPLPTGLSALTRLTQLRVTKGGAPWGDDDDSDDYDEEEGGVAFVEGDEREEQRAWGAAIARLTRLRWLSVPVRFVTGSVLHRLRRLQVLVMDCEGAAGRSLGRQPLATPPRLQLMCLHSLAEPHEVCLQVRRRMQQALGSSGCEVVVGLNLDVVADSALQLAGLPVALQQALA